MSTRTFVVVLSAQTNNPIFQHLTNQRPEKEQLYTGPVKIDCSEMDYLYKTQQGTVNCICINFDLRTTTAEQLLVALQETLALKQVNNFFITFPQQANSFTQNSDIGSTANLVKLIEIYKEVVTFLIEQKIFNNKVTACLTTCALTTTSAVQTLHTKVMEFFDAQKKQSPSPFWDSISNLLVLSSSVHEDDFKAYFESLLEADSKTTENANGNESDNNNDVSVSPPTTTTKTKVSKSKRRKLAKKTRMFLNNQEEEMKEKLFEFIHANLSTNVCTCDTETTLSLFAKPSKFRPVLIKNQVAIIASKHLIATLDSYNTFVDNLQAQLNLTENANTKYSHRNKIKLYRSNIMKCYAIIYRNLKHAVRFESLIEKTIFIGELMLTAQEMFKAKYIQLQQAEFNYNNRNNNNNNNNNSNNNLKKNNYINEVAWDTTNTDDNLTGIVTNFITTIDSILKLNKISVLVNGANIDEKQQNATSTTDTTANNENLDNNYKTTDNKTRKKRNKNKKTSNIPVVSQPKLLSERA